MKELKAKNNFIRSHNDKGDMPNPELNPNPVDDGGNPPEDNRPPYIQQNEVGTGVIDWQGTKIPFTVLRKSLAPQLPGFLGYPNGEYLFISEKVPYEFRYFQLIHEIIEFTELKGKQGRCLAALKRELALVRPEIKGAYLRYRKDFFARLVDYHKKSTDEDFKAEIRASLEHLQSIRTPPADGRF